MDLKNFKVDLDKVENGQWVGDIPSAGDLRLKVRGFSCLEYANDLMTRRQNQPRGIRKRDGSLPLEVDYQVTGETMAEVILLDWSGLKNGGQDVPFDKERALAMLTNREFKPFRDAVMWAGIQVDEARSEVEETILGNSGTSSNGSAPTGTSQIN